MAADIISKLYDLLDMTDESAKWQKRFEEKRDIVRKYYWDDEEKFFFDRSDSTGELCKVATAGSYWALTGKIASEKQAKAMETHLNDPDKFGGERPWVSLSRSDGDFNSENGMYWRGSVWLPTAYAGLRGCSNYGLFDTARKTATAMLAHMYRTWQNYTPHTIWECYAPCNDAPARSCDENNRIVREDFCGWSAIGPTAAFIEFVIGIYDIDAFKKVVKWNLPESTTGKTGIKNLRFGDITADLIAEDDNITVTSNKEFTLEVNGKKYAVAAGSNNFKR